MTSPYALLAARVVEIALDDVKRTPQPVKLKARGRYTGVVLPPNYAKGLDAADFLLRRFWEDDSLWREHLGGTFVQRTVRRRVFAVMSPAIKARLPKELRELAPKELKELAV